MYELLANIAAGYAPQDEEIELALAEMCDGLHAGDCHVCPFFELRNGDINRLNSRSGCDAFKDGAYLRNEFKSRREEWAAL